MRIPATIIQSAVERLLLVDPELEVACCLIGVAREGNLGDPRIDLIQDRFVGDIANLVVLMDDQTLFVAYATFTQRHHSIASIVRGADITVDTFPTLLAVAFISFPWRSVLAIRQRPT